ncbi:hypothetical protein [Pantanalinema sp. GBBB05]|uniref:hypothetical protein n=1 Tax=Pantanalinema sp. GBBB05 TaxID=2604139 RepID=UPI003D81A7CB
MMDLDQQLQVLIDEAPQDGTTPAVVAAIAPVLKQLATRLRHREYYVVQTLDGNWAVTTISHQTQADLLKQVIYAYPTLKDVAAGPYLLKDPQMIALPIPVTHILFQLVAVDVIDSVIFFETPGNTTIGTEIQREEAQVLVQTYLQQLQSAPTHLPPDIA